MTLQKRLKKQMRRREMRVADLARALNRPYTTVREWVLHGRIPSGARENRYIDTRIAMLEKMP